MRMPRPYICLKKSMETQEQKFTRELANSRMQIELLRNQVLLRYYAQLLELDIMQHPTDDKRERNGNKHSSTRRRKNRNY